MARLSVWVSDQQYEHVERQADERDCSMAEIVRELIDADRGAGGGDRLQELEERLTALEAGAAHGAPPNDRREPRGSDGENPAPDPPMTAESAESGSPPGSFEIPGSGSTATNRRETIERMREYLREHGSATKGELLELVDVERVGYASADSFWSNCVQGRDTLSSHPDVESPGPGGSRWRYVGAE